MTSDTKPTLHYEPLDTSRKSIRLLEVFPGEENDPIRCELIYADLDDNPSYIALSYTWNHDNKNGVLQCQDTTVEIGLNLFDFLHRYRASMGLRENIILQDRETTSQRKWSQRLWVDAVCINQHDDKERSSQVSLMDQIYTKAEFVITWLGEPSGPDEEAFLARMPYTFEEAYALRGNKQMDKILKRFLSKRYWTHMWIVQEFLIPNRLAIMCGPHVVDFSALDLLMGGRDFVDLVAKWLFTRRYIMQTAAPGNRYTLGENMTRFSLNDCSVPRDKVYALLGLADDARNGPNPIIPNYVKEEKSTIEVMVDVMRNQYGPREDVFGSLNHPVPLKTLRRALQVKILDVVRYCMQEGWNGTSRSNLFALASGMRVAVPLQCIGTVVQVLDGFSRGELSESDNITAKNCVGLWDSRIGVELEEGEAYAKLSLLSADSIKQSIRDIVDFTIEGPKNSPYDGAEIENPAAALSRSISKVSEHCNILTDIHKASSTCKVLVGTKGIRGIIREDKTIRDGDRIAVHTILSGAQYALILRQTTKHKWTVIAHAYIWPDDRADTPIQDYTYQAGREREGFPADQTEIKVCCDNDNDGLQILMLLSALKIIEQEQLTAIMADELEDLPGREHQCRTEKVPCDTIWLDRGLGDTPLFGFF